MQNSRAPVSQAVLLRRLLESASPFLITMPLQKVRGEPIFAGDLLKENMVFGKVLWSRFPHARIKKIDDKRAKEIPGVRAVLTAEDIPGNKCFGRIKADNPILCSDRVRFLGDAVALVFAESMAAARAGVPI